MLVLSRRPDEKILLPTVPAIIKVISSQASLTRLGIEAPSHVPILRAELCDLDGPAICERTAAEPADGPPSQFHHFVRDRLNNLILGLTLLRMHLVDSDPLVRKVLASMEDELQALRRAVAAAPAEQAGPPPAQPASLSPVPA
jgi:hypothetical protein